MTRQWFTSGLLVLALFFSLGAAQDEKSYSADRFDVEVAVRPDGSLSITETVIFRFVGGPFTFAYRELLTDHTDGISEIAATLDGRSLPPGDAPGQVEISGRDPLRVTWHFEPTSNSTHTFVLTYRMLGVVRQEADSDYLLYQVLPDDYEYAIGRSLTTFTYPAGATLLTTPTIEAGQAAMELGDRQVTWTAENLAPNTPLVIGLRFAPGSLISGPPQWQARLARQQAQAPLWGGLAAGVLAVGLVILLRGYQAIRPPRVPSAGLVYEPPDDRPPALAGALNGLGAKATWANALATLFDLARRGYLRIEEAARRGLFRSRDFVILTGEAAHESPLRPHEEALLELLFTTKHGRTEAVKLSSLSSLVSSRRWKGFSQAVTDELEAAGLVSRERQQAGRRLLVVGVLLDSMSFLGLLVVVLWLQNALGTWPLLVSLSLFVVGLVAVILGSMLRPLTDEGMLAAGQWQGFYHYLRDVTRGRAAAGRPDAFDVYLPYVTSYGLLTQWVKHFQKAGYTDVPVWFRSLAREDSMAAFVAMGHAASSSGGSAAGAAGAGAAG
ncbi:MAG: DUF2207 domain-containing protein, partial [Chloroflexota bacterium]